MLAFPVATTRKEKLAIIEEIKERLLVAHPENIVAIGVYGSLGLESDMPYSDIELHVITTDDTIMESHEFIYDKFKIELSVKQKREFFKQATEVDDAWAIKAGVFINIMPIYDPQNIFDEIKKIPLQVPDSAIRETMREFMIWEPYETIAKLRNNFMIENFNYIPMGAKDLTWQTAKLIGLVNKKYYSTRARTFEESIRMESKPSGYVELANCVMRGELSNIEHIYQLCESLWAGLNEWYKKLGIVYRVQELPSFK
ncbi:kanamycin nucleotidyltransferase C-terminal domain-containing protein [Bacillus sp. SD088]|uniref:kanamycin nucleotidyltransferase C-terminal domain-containing protein n=1 Tax=Bacillus sp. SD088 TaxID=2782012 RepID=UPI001A95F523|nr:kanamycin nucleotidyltransferase C-terminal domain-containing protein [Bacillus sp. SD088]MBO0996133.1 KNTase domain-containing protein [Bacillus sp. SD088]